jgi:hypothetical protein
MVTYAAAKRIALSFPETTEEPHFDMGSFRIRGKIFATVPDKQHFRVFVDEHESRAAAAEDPDAFELLWWGKKLSGLSVTLAAVDRDRLHELLDDAWRRKAPKRLAAEYDSPDVRRSPGTRAS